MAVLQDAPVIAQSARNRGIVRRLETRYYDTADHALFASGLSLRVQQQGLRCIQAVRQHGQDGAWARLVQGPGPDLAALDGAALPLPAALLELLSASPLTTVFEARLRRRLRRLAFSGALVEAAFDEGLIEAPSGQEAFASIRLDLQSGDPGVLYEIGMRLLELAPLRPDTASTMRRGYALASGVRPKAEKALPPTVAKDFVVDEVVGSVLSACQTHLLGNQAVAEDGSRAEGVHQMRVALRRLRTALSLLGREMPSPTMDGLAGEARWLADRLGPARGWDVFLAATLSGPERLGGADFAGLRAAAAGRRNVAYEEVRETIGGARYGRFQMLLSQWIVRRGWRNEVDRDGLAVLAEPATALAARVLCRLHRRALKQGRRFKRLSAEERHGLRITLKKLRYAVEFFLPLCQEAASARRFLGRLAALQDALGLDHDAATTQPLLDALAEESAALGVHRAIGVVAGWQGCQSLAMAELLAERWERFRALPLPFAPLEGLTSR